jgi:hypothetical protein
MQRLLATQLVCPLAFHSCVIILNIDSKNIVTIIKTINDLLVLKKLQHSTNSSKHNLPQNTIYWKIILDEKVLTRTETDLMAILSICITKRKPTFRR